MNLLKLKNWDKSTSLLHFGLALTVTLQLLTSQLMHRHINNAFLFHEIFGLCAVAIVFFHWLWNFSNSGQQFKHLFPWNPTGFKAITEDLKSCLKLQLPNGGPRPGLPGFIHGLGFLAVTGMAASGLIIFILNQLNEYPHWIRDIHSFIANFVWIYWIGHLVMAIIHHGLDRCKNRCKK